MDQMLGYTVGLLLYGDYPQLARRCFGSIIEKLDFDRVYSLRIGMNAVCEETRRYVYAQARMLPPQIQCLIYDSPINRCKYPMLRRILGLDVPGRPELNPGPPVITTAFMWFDDDSCIAPATSPAFWEQSLAVMDRADVAGKLYRLRIKGKQAEAIRRQPWYKGMVIEPQAHKFLFATGGFWLARSRFLVTNDYPFPAIVHSGGDTLLGELCRQQRATLVNYADGVWINADATGAISTAGRRGVSWPRTWEDFSPQASIDYSAHYFDLPVAVAQPGRFLR
jgi:hypothetical protein